MAAVLRESSWQSSDRGACADNVISEGNRARREKFYDNTIPRTSEG